MDYEQRLVNIVNFVRTIIISANGYQVQQLIVKLAVGELTFKQALTVWHNEGGLCYPSYEELMKELSANES